MRHLGRVLLLSMVLPACGSSPSTPSAPVAQVDVAPPAAPPETRFRGYVSIDVAPLAGQELGDKAAIDATARAATKDLVSCLRHEAPKPMDVWIVGRVNDQGHVELAETEKTVSPAVAACVNPIAVGLRFDEAKSFALSMMLRAEPAPSDCSGDDCTFIPTPNGEAKKNGAAVDPNTRLSADGAPEGGMVGLLAVGAGGDAVFDGSPGDSFGYGGLGLNGIGPGGGGTGEGIGLGSIGTIGRGAGGTGAGLGVGSLRLSGKHRGKVPIIKMGEMKVEGRLPPDVVKRIVRQNFARFRFCYENELRNDPTLEGDVVSKIIIGKTGDVTSVTDAKSSMKNAKVVQCVQKSLHALSFPQPEGGIVSATLPVHFEPGKEPPPPPVYTVNGVHFPVLTAVNVEEKLTGAGWRTMAVSSATPTDPFVVFALKSGDSTSPLEHRQGFRSVYISRRQMERILSSELVCHCSINSHSRSARTHFRQSAKSLGQIRRRQVLLSPRRCRR